MNDRRRKWWEGKWYEENRNIDENAVWEITTKLTITSQPKK